MSDIAKDTYIGIQRRRQNEAGVSSPNPETEFDGKQLPAFREAA
jgi:hypothetical protein